MKKALITGITGQDGSYLAELLLEKGYQVSGLVRRSSTFNTQRIDHLIEHQDASRFKWSRGDLADSESLLRTLREHEPDEVYHLAAQSHVQVSFEIPVYTFDTVATGTLRLLEAIRTLGLPCKVYNACSSEMYGNAPPPQDERTPFGPRSPYAVAKLAAYGLALLYRDAYGMPISNGLLFNHESPRRGETFVTRKVTRAVCRIVHGAQSLLELGNMDALRDWGYAPEYCHAMWMMLQQDEPNDYVIATNEQHSVREFVQACFAHVGIELCWRGEGVDETGVVRAMDDARLLPGCGVGVGDVLVRIDPRFFRPADISSLRGIHDKATKALGWTPKVRFQQLVDIMMAADLNRTDLLLHGTKKADEQWRQFII